MGFSPGALTPPVTYGDTLPALMREEGWQRKAYRTLNYALFDLHYCRALTKPLFPEEKRMCES